MNPVIAHPERNPAVQADLRKVATLVDAGALIQITAASLDGRLGSRTRASARKLVDAGLVHLIGSDAHSADIREVGLSGALPPRPTPTRRPGLLARLLGG